MTELFVILQAPQQGGGISFLLPLLMMVVVVWFFMIRPQSKKAAEEKKFREKLQQGDRVVTIGGIHGKITGVQETTVTIEVEGGQRLKMEKSAIARNVADTATTAEKK
ncbi:MAG TPA: preprotein translocase subunit YajC [Bacteroidia bacterium]|jgi:preprotein translocase subunit YajC